MDFSKVRAWMKKMNQILDLYEGNEDFTETERNLLMDYAHRIGIEIQKIKIEENIEGLSHDETFGKIKSSSTHVEQFVNVADVQKPSTVQENQTTPSEMIHEMNDQYAYLFEHLEVHDVYSKLALKPLTDIKSGLGLNEKILTQNELFNGDKSAFDEVVNDLNNCADFASAKNYLCQKVIAKYNWTNPSKEKIVDAFIKLVQRRHL